MNGFRATAWRKDVEHPEVARYLVVESRGGRVQAVAMPRARDGEVEELGEFDSFLAAKRACVEHEAHELRGVPQDTILPIRGFVGIAWQRQVQHAAGHYYYVGLSSDGLFKVSWVTPYERESLGWFAHRGGAALASFRHEQDRTQRLEVEARAAELSVRAVFGEA